MSHIIISLPRLQLKRQLLRRSSTKTSFLTTINSSPTQKASSFRQHQPFNDTSTLFPQHTVSIKSSLTPHPIPSTTATMSTNNAGSNTTSSGAPATDPYKAKNADNDVSLEEKVEALVKFAQANKFGMMTTRDAETGMLVSRCMAIAASVRFALSRSKRDGLGVE